MVNKTETLVLNSGRNNRNREKKTHSRAAFNMNVETISMSSEKGHQAHMEGISSATGSMASNPFHTGKLRQNAAFPNQMFQLCICVNTGKKYSFFGFDHTFLLFWVLENEYIE